MSILEQSPRKWTYDDYVLIPEDGLRHEIVDGVHVVNPAPQLSHQRLVGIVHHLLLQRVEQAGLGWVMLSPVDVRLGRHDIVQPDVLAFTLSEQEKAKPRYFEGAPSLVVEVLSPSTARHDRGPKFAAYDRAGVQESWILDPQLRRAERWSRRPAGPSGVVSRSAPPSGDAVDPERTDGLVHDGAFEEELPCHCFPGVSLPLDEVWRHMSFGRPEPD